MAALQQRAGRFRLLFRYLGKQYSLPIGKVSQQEAGAIRGKMEYLLLRLEQNLLHVPPDVSITDFLLADGQVNTVEKVAARNEPLTLSELCRRYHEIRKGGSMEANSLATLMMHLHHIQRTLGPNFLLNKLTLADLQRHVGSRTKTTYRGKKLSPCTIRKEISSFRAAWNWASSHNLVQGTFPSRGLVYPKLDEKPPFMTWEEIERAKSGLSQKEQIELWESLYLRKEELDEFLPFVKDNAAHPWIYPLICTASHTGARRSELLRAEVADVNLDAGTLRIREKKRARGQRTMRTVSLSPFLKEVLGEWLKNHPGGKSLFCWSGVVARSSKRSATTGHKGESTRAKTSTGRKATVKKRETPGIAAISRDEAHDHFRRTVGGSKWEVLRGYHVLRHSFISCLAAAGTDQRIIDEFVGHSTEEQRRRYRHLTPEVKHQAVAKVFG